MENQKVKTPVPLTDEQLQMLIDAVDLLMGYIDNDLHPDIYRSKWKDLKAYLMHEAGFEEPDSAEY